MTKKTKKDNKQPLICQICGNDNAKKVKGFQLIVCNNCIDLVTGKEKEVEKILNKG